MQNAQKSDLGSQVLRVGRDLKECRGAALEQEVIEDFRVVLTERVQLMWDSEYHMEVGHLCSREHKSRYVFFPVMLCLGASAPWRRCTPLR